MNVYRTFQLKDTKFKVGDDSYKRKRYHYQVSLNHQMKVRQHWMKATGIVRRIDDLGRIVIPKEIRRTLRIREGDPLEIFTDRDGEVILKKYSPISELGQFAKEYAETLCETLGTPALISDRDEMIAVSGLSKKDYLNRQLSPDIEEILAGRKIVIEKLEKAVEWIPGQVEQVKSYCIAPIVAGGDTIGAVYL